MQQLTNDQYIRLLQTEQVILIAKGSQEQTLVHKGFLALHSAFFAKVVDKPSAVGENGIAEFEIDCAATAIEVFVRWCYEGQFHSINIANASKATLIQRKILLIDLWIFGETYGIATIQNEAMDHLLQVLTVYPHLLTNEDVRYTFMRTNKEDEGPVPPLRHLVTMIAAVMLEVNAKKHGSTNIDKGMAAYEQYAQSFPGFMSLMHKWQRAWLILAGKSRGDKEKLPDFVASTNVQKCLILEEVEPPQWVLALCGAIPKKGFEDKEIIVLDD